MNNNRTVGIIATVITTLCCGCTGLFSCLFGAIALMNGKIDVNGVPTDVSPTYAISLLCLSVIFIAIPIAVAFFTFRKKPAAVVVTPVQPVPPQDYNGPIPPAS